MNDLRISLMNLYEFTKTAKVIPYKALYYMIGECNYGGRVTDGNDRRVLSTLLMDMMNPKIFYEHCYANIEAYKVPNQVLSYDEYLKHINSLPTEQPPELYGLHNNALIFKAINDTADINNKIIGIIGDNLKKSPKESSVAKKETPEDEDSETKLFTDLKAKIPARFVERMVINKYPVIEEESMNTVLQQEVSRFNKLIIRIANTLDQLIEALKGNIVMSDELEDMLNSINQKKTPKVWLEVSYPSLKPLASYIDDLWQRVNFFNKWIETGTPKLFWVSGFYFTQSFLTGILQNYARREKISIDLLEFEFEFDKVPEGKIEQIEDSIERPLYGCYIYGLYLEGWGWHADAKKLIENRGRDIITLAPIILVKPKEQEEQIKSVVASPFYKWPMYKTRERRGVLSTTGHSTNFIMEVDIFTNEETTFWVKRGVALICQLSE